MADESNLSTANTTTAKTTASVLELKHFASFSGGEQSFKRFP